MNNQNMQDCSCGCSAEDDSNATSESNNCCSPSSQSHCVWKTLLFVILIVAAAVVIVNGLLEKSDVSAGTGIRVESAGEQNSITQNSMSNVDPSRGIKADAKTTFYILDGNDLEQRSSVVKTVDNVVSKLTSQGIKVETVTIEADSADHIKLSKHHSITEYPGIVIDSNGNSTETVTGEITEAKLLLGYVKASQSSSGCGTKVKCGEQDNKSSCCPGKG